MVGKHIWAFKMKTSNKDKPKIKHSHNESHLTVKGTARENTILK